MPITTLPPAPEPTDSTSQFNAKSFAWVAALDQFTTEANDLAVSVNNDKNTTESIVGAAQVSANAAASSASNAALSASAALTHASAAAANTNAPLWVSGTTYAASALVYSALTGRTYRRRTAGGGTTDPSLDSTNWIPLFLEIETQRPSIRPSLLLDFANTKQLDPRITYSRASTGTYYDGKTVVKAEENLLLQSETFDNASWVKASTIVTANSLAAPGGATTADTLTASGANGTTLQTYTAVASPYTYSVWLYRKTGTGNVDITVDGTTWVTQTLTAGWTRFSTTLTPSAGSKTAGIRIVTSGDEVYAWGAQLEQRSTVTAYTPTTTQPITNYIPALQTAAAGVARFDHDPITGESKGFLIEEQRSNLFLRSEEFNNASWGKVGTATVATDSVVAPSGLLAGDRITGFSYYPNRIDQFVTVSGSTSYTVSLYAKSNGNGSGLTLRFSTNGGTYKTVESTVVLTPQWQRVSFTMTTNADNTGCWVILHGDGSTSSVDLWGAQLEAGAFPTSYIPTVASQVTRSADAASMTGSNFSSWYRADEGTVYAEAIAPNYVGLAGGFNSASISDGTNANFIALGRSYAGPTNRFEGNVASNSSGQAYFNPGDWAAAAAAKQTICYKFNDIAVSNNGSAVLTDTSVIVPVVNRMFIGADFFGSGGYVNGTIKRIAYYPKRLSNTELQGITS